MTALSQLKILCVTLEFSKPELRFNREHFLMLKPSIEVHQSGASAQLAVSFGSSFLCLEDDLVN